MICWKLKERKRPNDTRWRGRGRVRVRKKAKLLLRFVWQNARIRELHVLGRRLNGKDKSKTRCTQKRTEIK